MLHQHPLQLSHQHLTLKNKFINFKNYKKQKNITKNKKIVELRFVGTNVESQDDDPSSFSLLEIILFHSSSSSSSSSDSPKTHPDLNNQPNQTAQPKLHVISPKPYISSQFYTFNPESHSLMILYLRAATPCAVLKLWRAVWKDRNEDTAYLTVWKRIQDNHVILFFFLTL